MPTTKKREETPPQTYRKYGEEYEVEIPIKPKKKPKQRSLFNGLEIIIDSLGYSWACFFYY